MYAVQLYRRLESDLPRSGRITLRLGDRWYDLTEYLWQQELPMLVSPLCRRGLFHSDRVEVWVEETKLPPADPVESADRLLPPLLPLEVGKILALGKNFRAHAEEFSEAVPEEPLFFNKLPETLVGHNATIAPPRGYEGRLDHEAELAVVIGGKGKDVPVEEAKALVAGYSVANDLTLRSLQGEDREKKYPWFRAKNFDGACPLGPCFVPAEYVELSKLRLTSHVNGELRQEGRLSDLVVDVPAAIAYLSRHLTLRPGDIVLMGTPSGVGPLEHGDVVTCAIEEIGELTTVIERS